MPNIPETEYSYWFSSALCASLEGNLHIDDPGPSTEIRMRYNTSFSLCHFIVFKNFYIYPFLFLEE